MKKNLLIAAALGALTVSSYGQGAISLAAGGGKVKYTTDGVTLTSVPTGNPDSIGTYGGVTIAVYSASSGNTLTLSSTSTPDLGNAPNLGSPWAIQTTPLWTDIAPTPGAIGTENLTLDASSGATGSTVEMEVVAWTGSSTTFAQALTAAENGQALIGWSGSLLISGGSGLGWAQTTGDGVTSRPGTVTGTSAFNGLVLAPVPEPTTIAIGGLGAAALLLFRRRK